MKIFLTLVVLVLFHSPRYESCHIEFEGLDSMQIFRRVHERDIFNLTGQLEYCPSSIIVQNISITNSMLKRLSILNVSYIIETNRMNITALGRLIGFAPLTIQLYFQDGRNANIRSSLSSQKNATIEQKTCAQSSSNRQDLLQNCPMLRSENNFYILSETIHVAIKRHQSVIDILFTSAVIFLVTVGTLCIGCGLEIEQLTKNFRRPIPLIIGLFCQLIYIPCLSLGITKILRLDNSTSLGLISTASSPGKNLFSNEKISSIIFLRIIQVEVHRIFIQHYSLVMLICL